jgi:hypothetical protein
MGYCCYYLDVTDKDDQMVVDQWLWSNATMTVSTIITNYCNLYIGEPTEVLRKYYIVDLMDHEPIEKLVDMGFSRRPLFLDVLIRDHPSLFEEGSLKGNESEEPGLIGTSKK